MPKGFVIAASYSPRPPVEVELFARGEDGKSYTLLVPGFGPYFFVEVKPENEAYIRSRLLADSGVVVFKKAELLDGEEKVSCLRVEIHAPFDTPKYRADFEAMGLRVYAADIPFALRYLCDNNVGAFIEWAGIQVSGYKDRYKTDEVWQVETIRNVPAFEVPLKYLFLDCENRLGSDELYCISTYDGTNTVTFEGPDSWKKLQAYILSKDPDIIGGHNLVHYDLPLLDRNAGSDGLQIGRKWGRIQERPKEAMMVPGRVVADSLVWAKRTLSLDQNSLAYLAPVILGKQKGDVRVQDMAALWLTDKQRIIQYCELDTHLSYEIYQALNHMPRAIMLAMTAKLPLQEIFYHKNGIILDRLAIPLFDAAGRAVPPNKRKEDRTAEDDIAGAYVHDPEPGLYETVVVLDVASMYPSAIMEYNICPSTLTSDTSVDAFEVPLTYQDGAPRQKVARFKKSEAILPGLIRMLKDERKKAKTEMSNAAVGGNASLRAMWDNYQWSLKIVANAFYGLLASGFYRFTSPDIGNAITSAARATTLGIIRDLTQKGYKVVLSDTDSIGVALKDVTQEEAIAFGKELATTYSHGELQLELEKAGQPYLTTTKKRYVMLQFWPEKKRIERGYEVRRTDKFPLLKATQSKVMDLVLAGKSKEAITAALEAIGRIRAGAAIIEELIISKGVRDEASYANADGMIGVKMTRKLAAAKIPTFSGMKVSWLITSNEGGLDGVPIELYKNEAYCREYYEDAIAKSCGRILELFGWGEKALMCGQRQLTLGDWK